MLRLTAVTLMLLCFTLKHRIKRAATDFWTWLYTCLTYSSADHIRNQPLCSWKAKLFGESYNVYIRIKNIKSRHEKPKILALPLSFVWLNLIAQFDTVKSSSSLCSHWLLQALQNSLTTSSLSTWREASRPLQVTCWHTHTHAPNSWYADVLWLPQWNFAGMLLSLNSELQPVVTSFITRASSLHENDSCVKWHLRFCVILSIGSIRLGSIWCFFFICWCLYIFC